MMVGTFRTDLVSLVSMITPAHSQPARGFLFVHYEIHHNFSRGAEEA